MSLFSNDNNKFRHKTNIIAGPCALETKEQLRNCIRILKNHSVSVIRASLWKPRTRPGWDGLGDSGVDWLLEETLSQGMIPATEIVVSKHAESVVKAIKRMDEQAKVLLWIGSRNQNHFEWHEIAKILLNGPQNIHLMLKNQMWEDESHWLGIVEHFLAQGFPKERLLTCHRGFSPGKSINPHNYRNIPDFEMAMRVKEKLEIPIYFDPSHTGGTAKNVLDVAREALPYAFDGYFVEVHDSPSHAKTDVNQQLTMREFEDFLEILGANQALGSAF